MTSRPPRRITLTLVVACGLLAAACGSSSDSTDTTSTPEPVEVASTDDAAIPDSTTVVDTAPIETEPIATDAPTPTAATPSEPGAGTVSAEGDATWDGGDFVALAETRMDEIAVVFGQPATAASLAPTFLLPDDFPYPTGTVLGTFHVFARDLRTTDEVDIDEERIVGVDAANDVASFDALVESLAADDTTRWERSSSQRESFVNDLFTAVPLDGGESRDRLFVEAATEPEAGQPPVTFNFAFAPTEIPVPSWQAGLPVLDGGVITDMSEGRGVVMDFGRPAEDGYVSLRHFYPIERYDELEAFFASGVIAAAGFQYEETPFSNFDIRIDVSHGDWAGTVGVGNINVNNEDVGYELIWSLTRPAG